MNQRLIFLHSVHLRGKNLPHAEQYPGPLLTFKIEIFLTIVYDLNIVAIFPILDVSWGPDYPSEM